MRVDMKDRQLVMTSPHSSHDRMSDRMVAAEANQRIATLQRAGHVVFDQIPWIGAAVELNVAEISQSAVNTQICLRQIHWLIMV